MKRHLFLYIIFLSNIFGAGIIHEKIRIVPFGIVLPIEAFLNVDQTDIHRFSLLYRPFGNIEYIETPMLQIGKFMYVTEISGEFMKREFLEYYLLLELVDKTEFTFPERDAVHNPIRVKIDMLENNMSAAEIEKSNSEKNEEFDIIGLNPDVVIISPQPGERILRRDLFIALSYFSMQTVDPSQVKVYLDGSDVTEKADIDSSYLSIPTMVLTPGLHTVRINITNLYGQKYNDVIWSFTVIPGNITEIGVIKKQSTRFWTHYTGGVASESTVNISDANFLYSIDFDWLVMDARYSKSSLENKYNQPYDRYYLNFKNDFMKVRLGDSYPFIDEYAWNGKQIRGVNFTFAKGPLSLNILNGETTRAVQGNPAENSMVISGVDSTAEDWQITVSRNNYTFQQDVSALKLGLTFGENFHWDFNYIKIQDNIPTVSNTIDNAEIVIPGDLGYRINPNITKDDYFTISDSIYTIRFDSLKKNINNIFGVNDYLEIPSANWIGAKPRDNFIFGSNLQFGLDDSHIKLSSGFSISLLNRNKWDKLNSISELDTLAFDTDLDGLFLGLAAIDTTKNISQYEDYFNFGTVQQPMLPFIFQKDGTSFSNLLNMPNLNRYSKLQLRYIGHKVELGSKRNGTDYYSLLNPYLKTNYTESYISDRLNLFQNKLLLYYKRSKITEGLYAEQTSPTEVRKSLFNIALYPGSGLPTFNFGFLSANRNNNEDKIITSIIYTNIDSTKTDTIPFMRKEELAINQFNISMTNQFQFWGDQVLSVSILLFNQEDKAAENQTMDTLQALGYFPMDAVSESYGINLKSVYDNYWESSVYFNTSNYSYGWNGFDNNNDEIDDNTNQVMRNYQFKVAYHPEKYFKKLIYGFHYSTNRGNNYLTQYNFNFGILSQPFEKIKLNVFFDYRIKYLGEERKSANDSFIRAKLEYDIK